MWELSEVPDEFKPKLISKLCQSINYELKGQYSNPSVILIFIREIRHISSDSSRSVLNEVCAWTYVSIRREHRKTRGKTRSWGAPLLSVVLDDAGCGFCVCGRSAPPAPSEQTFFLGLVINKLHALPLNKDTLSALPFRRPAGCVFMDFPDVTFFYCLLLTLLPEYLQCESAQTS